MVNRTSEQVAEKLGINKSETSKIIKKNEEPNWSINEELYNAIFQKMPKNLSNEEKVMYIYCELCKELTYDEGYFFKEHMEEDAKYKPNFFKEHLESIKPGSKVTCYDFSRIMAKMINDLGEDTEALIFSQGENGNHYSVVFYTDDIIARLEAIQARTGGTNDLMKIKNGIELEGIDVLEDKNNLMKKAIENVYPQVFGKKQMSMKDYIQKLQELPREEVPNNLEKRLQSFTETMKENKISGNEAIQTFAAFCHTGFFKEDLDRAYVGKEEFVNGKKNYRRLALIKSKNVEDESLYLMDSDTLELTKHTSKEVIEKFNSGEYIYENENHKISGIDMEER